MSHTTRQSRDFVVLSDIAIQSDIFQVLPDNVRSRVTLTSTFTRRLQIIELLNELGETLLEELFTRDPGVELVIQAYQHLVSDHA